MRVPLPPAPADAEGRFSAALFVQWVPYKIRGSSWEREEEGYVRHLVSLLDRFAPGAPQRGGAGLRAACCVAGYSLQWARSHLLGCLKLCCAASNFPLPGAGASDLVVDTFTLNPTTIESYFGISRGHIHHIDNSFGELGRGGGAGAETGVRGGRLMALRPLLRALQVLPTASLTARRCRWALGATLLVLPSKACVPRRARNRCPPRSHFTCSHTASCRACIHAARGRTPAAQ